MDCLKMVKSHIALHSCLVISFHSSALRQVTKKFGSHAIVNLIHKSHRLELLDLFDNYLQEPSSTELVKALAHGKHHHLHALRLENNDMTEDVYKHLSLAVAEHLALNEDIDCDHVEAIVDYIEAKGGNVILEDPDEIEEEDEGRKKLNISKDAVSMPDEDQKIWATFVPR
ncbi:hypothetical protein C8J56DRAFT_887877 [Mycena floridula]|nr:hypothetical protein C8J56DRAFT_887877 [Mycena floridula]